MTPQFARSRPCVTPTFCIVLVTSQISKRDGTRPRPLTLSDRFLLDLNGRSGKTLLFYISTQWVNIKVRHQSFLCKWNKIIANSPSARVGILQGACLECNATVLHCSVTSHPVWGYLNRMRCYMCSIDDRYLRKIYSSQLAGGVQRYNTGAFSLRIRHSNYGDNPV